LRGCAGIEGEILRCAQNDGVTAKTKTKAKATGNSKWAQLKLAATGGEGGFVVRWFGYGSIGVVKTRGEGW
jgi:hypothetical protein